MYNVFPQVTNYYSFHKLLGISDINPLGNGTRSEINDLNYKFLGTDTKLIKPFLEFEYKQEICTCTPDLKDICSDGHTHITLVFEKI